MKVVCIDNETSHLTLNKIYDVELMDYGYLTDDIENKYKVIDDEGDRTWYYTDRFVLLEKFRTEQINKLLDESNMY